MKNLNFPLGQPAAPIRNLGFEVGGEHLSPTAEFNWKSVADLPRNQQQHRLPELGANATLGAPAASRINRFRVSTRGHWAVYGEAGWGQLGTATWGLMRVPCRTPMTACIHRHLCPILAP